MSWPRLLDTGSGELAWRLRIEAFPFEAVSAKSMEQTASDGRIRYVGLSSRGLVLNETVDLPLAIWEPRGFNVQIQDIGGNWTDAFKPPSARTYLASDATDTALSLTVKSTTGFATSGRVWVDSEVAYYTGTNTAGTAFNLGAVSNRGIWQSLAQYHYTPDGERARFPEVTDWPVVREGRRVYLYAYGAGDSKTGDGTLVWVGVLRREPSYSGLGWSLSVDALSKVFDAEIGGDLGDPVDIRGIYYPASSPLFIEIVESNDNTAVTSALRAANLQRWFAVAGFWETQEDFCDDLTTELRSQLSAGSFSNGTNVTAVPDGDSWAIRIVTPSSSVKWVLFTPVSAVDHFENWVEESDPSESGERGFSASTGYVQKQSAGFGRTPRATIGFHDYPASVPAASDLPDAQLLNVDPSTNPPLRVHLGGYTSVTTNTTQAQVEWDSNGARNDNAGTEPFTERVDTVSSSSRYIELANGTVGRGPGSPGWYAAVGAGVVQIRLGRDMGTGSLADFITTLTGETAQFLNTGAVPDVREADFETLSTTDIADAALVSPIVASRQYTLFAPINLKELIEQECRLLGVYPCYSTNGKITFRKLRLPALAEATDVTLTKSNILTDDQWLRYERGGYGTFASVRFLTGYDPVEDDHTGRPVLVRDVSAYGQSTRSRTLEIAPKSNKTGIDNGLSIGDAELLASRVLGTFGGPYARLEVDVNLTAFPVLLGDAVRLTWVKVPNQTGGKGVTNKVGIVVARKWDFMAARGTLTLLVTDQKVAGYSPCGRIESITSGTTGTTGPFTVKLEADALPSGTTWDEFLETSDKIRIYRWNSMVTSGNVTATIGSVSGNNVTFTADSNWTYGANTWVLDYQVATSITQANQKLYASIADSGAIVDYSGDTGNPAFTLA